MNETLNIEIAGRKIGQNEPTFVIAEIGVNHNGDIDLAHKLIDGAIESGADAVKFQTIDADASYVPGTPSHDIFSKISFGLEEYEAISNHCKEKGIIFFTTPGDWPSLEICRRISVPAVKISSGLMTNTPIVLEAATLGVPLVISTGGAYLWEIGKLVNQLEDIKFKDFTLLHCVSIYPADDDTLNLKAILDMQESFPYPIGYSDHSLGITAVLSAVTLGAKVVEKHFTLSKELPGGDNFLSSEPDEFKELVEQIRACENMLIGGSKKPHKKEIEFRERFRRRLVANRNIEKDEILTSELVGLMRPLQPYGLSPDFYQEIIGKKASKKISKYDPITLDSINFSDL